MITQKHKTASAWRTGLLVTILLMVWVLPSHAGWWIFGKKDDVPEITDLLFNKISMDMVENEVMIGRDNLDFGQIVIRGTSDVGEGKIGKVEVSFDDGATWKPTRLGDRGKFTYQFKPMLEEEYSFRIRALSTTGKKSDPEEHSFTFVVSSRDDTAEVKKAVLEMIRHYANKDRRAFMDLVSQEFEGNLSELEDAIADDFYFFDNIKIEPNIGRVIRYDGHYEVYFTFNRQLQSIKTGQILRDNAATTANFVFENGKFLLNEMAAPLIFGISNPEEIATSVTEESVGAEVITVSDSGEISLATQEQSVVSDSRIGEVESGTLTAYFSGPGAYMDAVSLEDNTLRTVPPASNLSPGELSVFRDCSAGPAFFTKGGGEIKDLGPGNLDSNVTFPTSGFVASGFTFNDVPALTGHLYAFRATGGGNYLFEVTLALPTYNDGNCLYRATTNYRYKEVL